MLEVLPKSEECDRSLTCRQSRSEISGQDIPEYTSKSCIPNVIAKDRAVKNHVTPWLSTAEGSDDFRAPLDALNPRTFEATVSEDLVVPDTVADPMPEVAEYEEGEMEEEELQELSQALHVIVEDSFLVEDLAVSLRGVFDERFQDPRKTTPERFLWDYWHIPNQYTLVRTQAQVYFPGDLYDQLEDALISYGETYLGCRAITPVWMSYYIDGCSQELHCDNPHGPFAFVLSLTDWENRKFLGGETMILKPGILDYWGSVYQPHQGLEQKDIVRLVKPHFNRLTVFDPRFPHGVRRVSGTHDPMKARLVLHGWFTEPSPFFTGALTAEEASDVLNTGLESLYEDLASLPQATGTLSVRLNVSGENGAVTEVRWLADTLIPIPGSGLTQEAVRAGIQHTIQEVMLQLTFPTPSAVGGGDTLITLPVVFE
eukprot:gene2375-8682_t